MLKKLTAAGYLRGIYDELIRFCKFKKLIECDMKLLKFNEKRKTEKKSPKEEREEFFKEFGNYLMEIVDYVKVEIIPMFESSPRDALL